MQQQEVISAVKQTAGIPTHEAAETTVRATLRALGERLAGGEPSDLAAQLAPRPVRRTPATGRRRTLRTAGVLPTSGTAPRRGRQPHPGTAPRTRLGRCSQGRHHRS